MITHLNGPLVDKGTQASGEHFLVIDVGGVGFHITTHARALAESPECPQPVHIYTALVVREDAMNLIGFLTRTERDMYTLLSSASGVGPKVALSLLADMSVNELSAAIISGDAKRLSSAKGVGPKLAQKLSIELKEKVTTWRETQHFGTTPSHTSDPTKTPAFEEAETVLLSLGYTNQEIYDGLQAFQDDSSHNTAKASSEEVLQFILKWLANHTVS